MGGPGHQFCMAILLLVAVQAVNTGGGLGEAAIV